MSWPDRSHGGAQSVVIRRFADLAPKCRQEVEAQMSDIFFEASSVRSFASAQEKSAFHWRWLGRYLAEESEHAFVSLGDGGAVVGYLVGSLRDPAQRAEFAELSYFRDFADLTPDCPAHLHVNVKAGQRGKNVGALLVEEFCAHARGQGVRGVHVVTGAGMRNVHFYERLGFREVGRAARNGGIVVMLALPFD
jgi:GNAT superfamily N-acetyltransferase